MGTHTGNKYCQRVYAFYTCCDVGIARIILIFILCIWLSEEEKKNRFYDNFLVVLVYVHSFSIHTNIRRSLSRKFVFCLNRHTRLLFCTLARVWLGERRSHQTIQWFFFYFIFELCKFHGILFFSLFLGYFHSTQMFQWNAFDF